jgi:hypothetical protein
MSTVQAFLLGMMMAWTPCFITLSWLIWVAPLGGSEEPEHRAEREPAQQGNPSHRGEQSKADNKYRPNPAVDASRRL